LRHTEPYRLPVATAMAVLAFTLQGWSTSAIAQGDIDSLDNVADYAKGCYAALGLAAGALEPAKFDCTAGTLLPTCWTYDNPTPPPAQVTACFDASQGAGSGQWPDGSVRTATQFPPKCDTPAWLSNKCYGHSYVQKLTTGNDKVAAVLMCRHAQSWSDATNDFDDIAIIVNNHESGKTCWFQTVSDGTKFDGKNVVPPSKDATTAFWQEPQVTAASKCNRCHDNGPWMSSPWIYKARVVPTDTAFAKYETPGAAFGDWDPHEFVTVAAKKMRPSDGNRSCSSCHAISRKLYVGNANGYENHGTWGRWIDWTTRAGGCSTTWTTTCWDNGDCPAGETCDLNFATMTNDFGKTWPMAGWMPSRRFPADHEWKADQPGWKKVYMAHVRELKKCAADPNTCKPRRALLLNPVGGATRVTVRVSNAASTLLTQDATETADWVYGTTPIASGEILIFSWTTEGVSACNAELTLPDGVSVMGLETGSNSQDAAGSFYLGPVNTPGEYALDVNCDGRYASSGEYVDPPLVGVRVVASASTAVPVPALSLGGIVLLVTALTLSSMMALRVRRAR